MTGHENITRAEARARGIATYYTGKPCRHGHSSPRFTSNGKCKGCQDASNRAFYQQNTDAVKAQTRQWRTDNKDAVRRAQSDYAARNAERLNAARKAWVDENRESIRALKSAWAKKNSVSVAASRRKHFEANRESLRLRHAEFRAANPEKMRQWRRAWLKANPHFRVAEAHARRAKKLNATPPWFGEFDEFVMDEAARLCAERKAATGIEWHVDHIIPLRARSASGLHIAGNVQVIPATLNYAKNNKMVLTQPLEWLKHI